MSPVLSAPLLLLFLVYQMSASGKEQGGEYLFIRGSVSSLKRRSLPGWEADSDETQITSPRMKRHPRAVPSPLSLKLSSLSCGFPELLEIAPPSLGFSYLTFCYIPISEGISDFPTNVNVL